MSYELADSKNPVRISVSFDPFPRRWFVERNHASARACRLSLMLTVFFFFFFLSYARTERRATVHFYAAVKWKMSADTPI